MKTLMKKRHLYEKSFILKKIPEHFGIATKYIPESHIR